MTAAVAGCTVAGAIFSQPGGTNRVGADVRVGLRVGIRVAVGARVEVGDCVRVRLPSRIAGVAASVGRGARGVSELQVQASVNEINNVMAETRFCEAPRSEEEWAESGFLKCELARMNHFLQVANVFGSCAAASANNLRVPRRRITRVGFGVNRIGVRPTVSLVNVSDVAVSDQRHVE